MQVNQKGHCYLELVEKQGNYVQAKLRANIWYYIYRSISSQFRQATGTELSIGLKGLFNVSVNFHEVYGLSLTVNDIDPNFTIGERSRKREETINQLYTEGLLGLNKKLPLPIIPQRIAIISSQSAAGYEDFVNQLERNDRRIDFQHRLFHSIMQGNEAPKSIVKSIQSINSGKNSFDVIVMIRGGGSKTDLDAFDDYSLCEALAKCEIPVISGIGHERDESIVDMVAHTPLKTPTAVAEFLISGANRFEDRLYEYLYVLERNFNQAYNQANQHLDLLGSRLENSASQQLRQGEFEIERVVSRLNQTIQSKLHQKQIDLNQLQNKIELLNPQRALDQGYSLTLKKGKRIDPELLEIGDEIQTRAKNIQLKSTITELKNG